MRGVLLPKGVVSVEDSRRDTLTPPLSPNQRDIREHEIRDTLRRELEKLWNGDPGTIILDEVGLRHGAVRIDLMVLNGFLEGYEFKSDRDNLRRLRKQADTYNRILDKMTLVVGLKHLEKVLEEVPVWWGIRVAERGPNGEITLTEVRRPTENPSPEGLATAKLLWRAEALELLRDLGAAEGYENKRRAEIYERVAEVMDEQRLRDRVREVIKSRTTWRSAARQTSGGG